MIGPEPEPDVADCGVNQELSDDTVQGQLACVVIVAVSVPAGMHALTATGATEYSH